MERQGDSINETGAEIISAPILLRSETQTSTMDSLSRLTVLPLSN